LEPGALHEGSGHPPKNVRAFLLKEDIACVRRFSSDTGRVNCFQREAEVFVSK
jgi:hypothetical protein